MTTSNPLRHLPLAAALLAASATAQYASYSTYGSSCVNNRKVLARVSGTAPIRGKTTKLTVSASPGASGVLFFAGYRYTNGISLSAAGLTNCRLYVGLGGATMLPVWLGGIGRTTLTLPVPATLRNGSRFYNQAFLLMPNANPAGMIASNGGMATVGAEPPLTLSEIKSFAPLVRIHPSEVYNPMDPMQFIKVSRFRHHRSFWADQGYNKRTGKWVTTNSKHIDYFDIPVSFINSYGLHSNGKNRRPRDSNSGDDWNVFLESEGRQYGERNPNSKVPVFYYYRRSGSDHYIQYWWFNGFNDAPATINHQGDWEHVTVRVRDRQIYSIFFSAHHGGANYLRSLIQFSGTHPIVYMAKGTHASYRKAGTFYNYIDKCADGGAQWSTHLNLQPLQTQPWKDFAGAWGSVGTIETTTGPLGPWHKRNNN